MDPLVKSRLRADYERLHDNTFWQAYVEELKRLMSEAERAPVHLDLLYKDAIITVAEKKGAFQAFRSVLGLPQSILDRPRPKP